eukprot:Gb_33021 [translate_table: standard]
MNPAFKSFCNSSLTSRATLGCIFLSFCLTGLASAHTTRWCTTKEGSNPGMSEYVQAKISVNSVRRLVKTDCSSRLRLAPSSRILGFSSVPMLTLTASSTSNLEPSSNCAGAGGRLSSSSISASKTFSPTNSSLFS